MNNLIGNKDIVNPQEFSDSYHKARRSYGFFSGILIEFF
jgi:hypothetical protein